MEIFLDIGDFPGYWRGKKILLNGERRPKSTSGALNPRVLRAQNRLQSSWCEATLASTDAATQEEPAIDGFNKNWYIEST
jgi:hypothetical protein